MKYEIEQKYRIKNHRNIKALLREIGATRIRSGTEKNCFYERKGGLTRRGVTLRLREYCSEGLMTIKGPREDAEDYHKRLELETSIKIPSARMMLSLLGFRKFAAYKKKRDEYKLGAATITMDYLPNLNKWFLEIEASPGSIQRISRKLSLKPKHIEERSYFKILFGSKRKVLKRKVDAYLLN